MNLQAKLSDSQARMLGARRGAVASFRNIELRPWGSYVATDVYIDGARAGSITLEPEQVRLLKEKGI